MLIRKYFVVLILFLILAMTVFGCGKEGGADKESSKTEDVKKEKKATLNKEEAPIPVEVSAISTGIISSYILLSSNLETERMTDVYSRVQGLVDRILVEEGDHVKKGQLLMQLDPDELELMEAGALVNYEQEKKLFERKRAMFDRQLLSKEEFETASFGVQAKKILWQEARLNLDHTKVTSPISGVIGERLRRPGDRIQPSDKLFTVINTDEMIAIVHVPEKEVGIVRKGQKAFVSSQHLGDEQFSGWVKRVSPVVDPQSGTFKVTVGIGNEENRLRPGMFVNAHIVTDVHANTVLVPKTAIVYESDKMHVFVVRDSIAQKIQLAVGYQDFEKVESLSGIEPGEKVIVVGQAGLKQGARVGIVAQREIAFKSAGAGK